MKTLLLMLSPTSNWVPHIRKTFLKSLSEVLIRQQPIPYFTQTCLPSTLDYSTRLFDVRKKYPRLYSLGDLSLWMEGKTIFVDKQSDIVDITRFLIRHSGSGGCLKIMIFCFPVSLIASYLVLIVFINNFYISKPFSINNLPCMNLLNPTKFVFKRHVRFHSSLSR